ncbi:hypothetical protein GHT06_018405 [Daphnia sinensis]|uniref:Uncharacterized protein n=1 Tax=Daphnia sinensis TaxID=1820382 RepID=A0AAD5LDV4_9CRUS|nr:hypothetical protein GHT06_018405 [Daphnia sinensis]
MRFQYAELLSRSHCLILVDQRAKNCPPILPLWRYPSNTVISIRVWDFPCLSFCQLVPSSSSRCSFCGNGRRTLVAAPYTSVGLFLIIVGYPKASCGGGKIGIGKKGYEFIFFSAQYEYFRCRKYESFGCLTGSEHNHKNETEEIRNIAVVNECVQLAVEQRNGLKRRLANQPSIPQTTEEAKRLLQQYPVYSHTINKASLFFHGRVSSTTGLALIFLSLAVLDGTFYPVPNLFYQLFMIHIMYNGKSFPIAYVLMTKKTLALYDSVMRRILERPFLYPCNMHFQLEEVANAGSTIHRPSTEEPAKKDLRLHILLGGGWVVVRRIIKMLIALALLPQERIFEGFQCIRNTTADDLERETQEVRGAIAQLFTFYGGYWIASQGPERISVCDDDDRTNNPAAPADAAAPFEAAASVDAAAPAYVAVPADIAAPTEAAARNLCGVCLMKTIDSAVQSSRQNLPSIAALPRWQEMSKKIRAVRHLFAIFFGLCNAATDGTFRLLQTVIGDIRILPKLKLYFLHSKLLKGCKERGWPFLTLLCLVCCWRCCRRIPCFFSTRHRKLTSLTSAVYENRCQVQTLPGSCLFFSDSIILYNNNN